ncbi:unnamed protein product [Scytosiphon promiscuus]
MALATAAAKKKMPRRAAVAMAIAGLLLCCSLALRARVARLPALLPSPAARGGPAEAEITEAKKEEEGLVRRQRISRSDCCGGDGETRDVAAAASDQNEDATAEEEEQKAGEAKVEEGTSPRGREKKTDGKGAAHATNTEATATGGTRSQAVPPPAAAAAASAATARLSAATAPAAAVSAVADDSDRCWIFMHLQKSGGSTVKEILTASWGQRFFIYDNMRWKQGDEFSRGFGIKLASATPWNVMAGGYTEALRRVPEVEEGCQFFTLFRHPIARIVSAYYYCKVLPLDKACASEVVQATDVDLLGFAKHWGNFAVRQFALSFVPSDDVQAYIRTPEARALHDVDLATTSGWFQLKAYLERPLEEVESGEAAEGQRATQEQLPGSRLFDMLQPAQELITNGYTVGVLEEWNTTLALFDSALAMPGMDWRTWYARDGKQNVNRAFEQLKAQTLEKAWTDPELKKYLQLDLLLYEHAVDVFHKQARSRGVLR